tara:strand:+ start:130 stop:459 length:330 start_codon:yes stop_codon:yes gene_type:complete
MSIKLAVLENKEQVIADIKELVDDDKPVGYIFNKPHRVYAEQKFFSENSEEESRSVEITLSPWILLSADKDVLLPKNHVVTIVEPIESVKTMYQEKLNGTDNQGACTIE